MNKRKQLKQKRSQQIHGTITLNKIARSKKNAAVIRALASFLNKRTDASGLIFSLKRSGMGHRIKRFLRGDLTENNERTTLVISYLIHSQIRLPIINTLMPLTTIEIPKAIETINFDPVVDISRHRHC